MAEGWATALKGGQIEAFSAGVEPHGMNPRAIKAMAEAGVDISTQSSKHVDTLADIRFDYVVTVCGHANETCPMFAGNAKVVHVGFDDPPKLAKGAATEEQAMAHYRRVRDEIRDFVEALPGSLEHGGGPWRTRARKPVVVFMCVSNSCRSQMAEGFLRALGGDRFDARSIGLEPATEVHPLAVQVMREIGIDITGQKPKPSKAYLDWLPIAFVVYVCAQSELDCPRVFPGVATELRWPFDDPSSSGGTTEEKLKAFRRVRDEIGARISTWLTEVKA
jgi:arsenate reductase